MNGQVLHKRITMVTFNIAHGRGLSLYQGFKTERKIRRNLIKISELLLNEGADIVALQEVDVDSHWNRNLNLLEIIRKHAEFQFADIGIHNRREGPKPLSYGNAVLSRYPFHNFECNPFGNNTIGEKGFLYVELNIGEHVLPLINLHLDFRSRQRRIVQVDRIIDYIVEKNSSHDCKTIKPIICGDFNSGSKKYGDAVETLFSHVCSHGDYNMYPENARTFPAQLPTACIDFVMLPAEYRLLRCDVVKSYASDHRPVVVEFEITV